jgi:hypothetical protein
LASNKNFYHYLSKFAFRNQEDFASDLHLQSVA